MVTPPPPIPNTPILEPPLPEAHTSGPIRTQHQSTTARMRTGPMSAALKAHVAKQMAKGLSKTPRMPAGEVSITLKVTTNNTELIEPTLIPQPLGDEPPPSPQSPGHISDDVPCASPPPDSLDAMTDSLAPSGGDDMSVDEVSPVAATTTFSVPCGFIIEVKFNSIAGVPYFIQTPQPNLLFVNQDERLDWLLTAVNDFLRYAPYYLCLDKVVDLFLAQEARLGYPVKVISSSLPVFACLPCELP